MTSMTAPSELRRPPIRVLDLAGSPEAMGIAHGRAFADEIRHYTNERMALVCGGSWSGGPIERGDVLDLAASCLPAHEAYDSSLYEELLGLATGAGISPAEAVVVGGFTDFVDAVRALRGGAHPPEVMEDDCTSVIVPDHRAGGAGFFAQTWDMHDTATDHVLLLRVDPDDAPAALVFTTTGCLGQLGMNELGVCVGINNLTAADGKVGVTWPSVVRRALQQESAAAALATIQAADLAGGHNFLVFDATGEGYNVEAMPSARPVDALADRAIVHTNHTLHASTIAVEGQRAEALNDSSRRRLETGRELLDRDDIDEKVLMELTREPGAICQVPIEPYRIESSGAAVMRPQTREFWACWGQPAHNDYELISFPGGNGS